jgi:hypothetical protein
MKRKSRRYAEGGSIGYEEDPKPGVQSDKALPRKKSSKKDSTDSRRISAMEFIKKYEDSPASSRIKEEASAAAKKSRRNDSSEGRYSGVYGETREALASLSPEEKKKALEMGVAGAAALAGVGSVARANIPLRVKQAMRRMETARINEAERAADKAGEAARRGMSRRGIPRYDERYRASSEGSDRRAAYADELPEGLKFKRGGSVGSSASRRADGKAVKGKTRGRVI